ncbi:hypothetical protein QVD17_08938 [Tagetes erecta]|uniref:Uncharacterized protein n=1 Tax=Tagetes erecta TaxID=13708 RepID=A0AAD8P4I6_TARER|nr:hypothetical protein QVD17_08938 [Tagetes erecta]
MGPNIIGIRQLSKVKVNNLVTLDFFDREEGSLDHGHNLSITQTGDLKESSGELGEWRFEKLKGRGMAYLNRRRMRDEEIMINEKAKGLVSEIVALQNEHIILRDQAAKAAILEEQNKVLKFLALRVAGFPHQMIKKNLGPGLFRRRFSYSSIRFLIN